MTKRGAAVVLSFVLGGSAVLAQARPKQHVDLSAKAGADVFKVPESVWTDINRFVFFAGFELQGVPGAVNVEYSKHLQTLNSYPALRTAAQRWASETFPLLQNIAADLAHEDMHALLSGLMSSYQERKSHPERFARHVEELNRRFGRLSHMIADATQQEQNFYTHARAAIREYHSRGYQGNDRMRLGPDAENLEAALGLMNGQWGALASDVKSLQERVLRNDLDDLDIEIGLATWADVRKSAAGFLAELPVQRSYLTGDNFYQNCPFDEAAYYYIQSEWQFPLLSANGDMVEMLWRNKRVGEPVIWPSDARQQWQLRRIGQGWFRIVNRSKGPSFGVDIRNDGREFPLVLAAAGNYTGQAWRCMPAGRAGLIRLINAFNGESRWLSASEGQRCTTAPSCVSGSAFMGSPTYVPARVWRLVPVSNR